ncbi:MAG: hypothetical protein MJ175_13175, partial [Clostridia bacterium]|nr:hypothetical protein [Clostridia bacterium]
MSMLTQYESVFGALFYGWIYCIELFSAFLILRAWEQRHPVLSQIPCLIALIYALFLLHALTKKTTILDTWLYEMPLYFWFLNLAILSLSLAVVYVRDSVWKKTHVSDISVKESLDTLPTGVCYYEENGYVGLANDRMRTLCQMMTGLSLENGAQFRDAV